jgi:hypothetical protein
MAKKNESPRRLEGVLGAVRVEREKLVLRLEHAEGGKLTQTEVVFALQDEGSLDEIVEAVEELRLQFAEGDGEEAE